MHHCTESSSFFCLKAYDKINTNLINASLIELISANRAFTAHHMKASFQENWRYMFISYFLQIVHFATCYVCIGLFFKLIAYRLITILPSFLFSFFFFSSFLSFFLSFFLFSFYLYFTHSFIHSFIHSFFPSCLPAFFQNSHFYVNSCNEEESLIYIPFPPCATSLLNM